jgi:hypothetical protein
MPARARDAFTDALLDGPVRAWGLPQTTMWWPSGRWRGICDFRGVAILSGTRPPSFVSTFHAATRTATWRLLTRSCCVLNSRHSRRPRHLAWPRTPDFQTGRAPSHQSWPVSSCRGQAQGSPVLWRGFLASTPVTEDDGLLRVMMRNSHLYSHLWWPTIRVWLITETLARPPEVALVIAWWLTASSRVSLACQLRPRPASSDREGRCQT